MLLTAHIITPATKTCRWRPPHSPLPSPLPARPLRKPLQARTARTRTT
jgi:hypothetical protein